jgi:hypothetical protein
MKVGLSDLFSQSANSFGKYRRLWRGQMAKASSSGKRAGFLQPHPISEAAGLKHPDKAAKALLAHILKGENERQGLDGSRKTYE